MKKMTKNWMSVICTGVVLTGGGASIAASATVNNQDNTQTKQNNTSTVSSIEDILNTQNNILPKVTNNVSKKTADKVSRSEQRKSIDTINIYLIDNGSGSTITLPKGSTIDDLKKQEKIKLNGKDSIPVKNNVKLQDKQVITINRVTEKTIDKNGTLKFKSINGGTATCTANGSVVTTLGKDGATVEKWQQEFTNGKLTGEKKLGQTIKTKPTDEVVKNCITLEQAIAQAKAAQKNPTSTTTSSAPSSTSNPTDSTSNSTDNSVPQVTVSGSATDWMKAAGVAESDYGAVDYIVTHESGWNPTAVNASSGAYGLCQALPAGKLASAGADWKTNPVTQMKWCNSYASERYGNWTNAYKFWVANHWW